MALKRFRGLAGIGVGAFLDRAAVVQQVYGQLVRRIIDLGRGGQGDPQQVGFLVIARHQDIDGRQQFRIGGERDFAAVRPGGC